jgi:hypothetical protein
MTRQKHSADKLQMFQCPSKEIGVEVHLYTGIYRPKMQMTGRSYLLTL